MVGPESPEYLAQILKQMSRRYSGATPDSFVAVLCPLLVKIESLDKTIKKLPGQSHYRASFTVKITGKNQTVLQVGRTGKFVPSLSSAGGVWREIAKGRITHLDRAGGIA